MKNIYLKIPELKSVSSDLVLATVAGNTGSTPQKAGSSALFNRAGLITGTVGGGVVEGRVKDFAISSSRTKKSGLLRISLNKDISDKEEAICGGELSILVDASPYDHLTVFRELSKSINEKDPGVLITKVSELREGDVKITRYWMTKSSVPVIPEKFPGEIRVEVDSILSGLNPDDFRQVEFPGTGPEKSPLFLLEPVFPLPQLVIAGAGHIGKALSHLGKMLDFEVTIIDDREEFANPGNLPDADHILVADIGNTVKEIKKNPDTYIVIVTRGHKDDTEALKSCIKEAVAYIGMIGSRGKVAKMHTEFISSGWATEEEWSRIHAPVGLSIMSKTVEEIAVSIAAELIQVKNSRR